MAIDIMMRCISLNPEHQSIRDNMHTNINAAQLNLGQELMRNQI